MPEHVKLKIVLGTLKRSWVLLDTRDSIVDFVKYLFERTEIPVYRYQGWLELSASKHINWQKRYGKVNEHNAKILHDFWLAEWEQDDN